MQYVNDTRDLVDPSIEFADLLDYNQMANLDFKSLSDEYVDIHQIIKSKSSLPIWEFIFSSPFAKLDLLALVNYTAQVRDWENA